MFSIQCSVFSIQCSVFSVQVGRSLRERRGGVSHAALPPRVGRHMHVGREAYKESELLTATRGEIIIRT